MVFAYDIHWGGVYDAVVEHMYATGCGTSSEMTMIALEEDF